MTKKSNTTPRVLLLGYQSVDPDPEVGRRSLTGDTSVLDKWAPGWTDFPVRNLLHTPDDDADPKERADEILYRFPGRIVIAFGREVAQAIGLPRKAEWFKVYATEGSSHFVIPVPQPTKRNRTWNDPKIRRSMTQLFNRLGERDARRDSGHAGSDRRRGTRSRQAAG